MLSFPKYESYQSTAEDWLGDIPQHWQLLRTKSIFRLVAEPAPKNNDEELLSVYSDIGVKPRRELEERGNKASMTDGYWLVKKGDIIVNKLLAWMGAIGLSEYDGVTSPAYDILRDYKPINSKFYHYLFRNPICINKLKKHSKGIMEMRLRLYFDEFGNIKIPYPPLEDQNRIVDFLDRKTAEIDQAIEQKQRLIKLLKEQKAILIDRAITKGLNPNIPMKDSGATWLGNVPAHWQVYSVKRLAQILRGKFSHRPRNDPRFYDGQYPFIQTGDISRSGRRITEYSQTLNEAGYAISKEFPVGTVVMVITGAKTGEVSILGFNACFPDSAVGFVPMKERVSSDFLYYMFNVLKSGLDSVVIISTQENLNVDRIGSLCTVCPPLDEQIKIVNFLDTLLNEFEDAQIKIEEQIKKLQEYHQLIIANVVTGKIKI